ncbi:MAG: UbiD family decarboxylase, partial (plasmid) [Pantoea sp. Brub]|nr:UbiD family decarboxylase [Pantoea sp. Brub]
MLKLNKNDTHNWQTPPIDDLRSAISFLKNFPDQYIETNRKVDPMIELAGVYSYVSAASTIIRPTQIAPTMIFNNIKDFPDFRILVGLMASRKRVSLLLGAPMQELGMQMVLARKNKTAPIFVNKALCQEVIYFANDKKFDLRKILPSLTNTVEDAGPYFCLGLVLGSDIENRINTNVSIHRLCIQSKDELSIFLAPGRHINIFRKKAESVGKSLPISINIGLDPAIYIGAGFEAPITPFGFNELYIAGGLRKKPIELVECLTIKQKAIAKAEIVIEGEILPNIRIA